MTANAPSIRLEGLAGRLTDLQDRQTYAALMCYLTALPEGDEFRQLAELFGLLSIVGQRIPDAVAELLTEFRAQTSIAVKYNQELQDRLTKLPDEIVAGVDSRSFAQSMSESFRQQLSATSLQETASLLKAATITLKGLSTEITTTLKPTADGLSKDIENLVSAKRLVEGQNSRLLRERRFMLWVLVLFIALVMFLLGMVYGGSRA